jgi:hypothetical protein
MFDDISFIRAIYWLSKGLKTAEGLMDGYPYITYTMTNTFFEVTKISISYTSEIIIIAYKSTSKGVFKEMKVHVDRNPEDFKLILYTTNAWIYQILNTNFRIAFYIDTHSQCKYIVSIMRYE